MQTNSPLKTNENLNDYLDRLFSVQSPAVVRQSGSSGKEKSVVPGAPVQEAAKIR